MTEQDKELQELRRENANLRQKIAEITRENKYIDTIIHKAIERYGIPVQSVVAMEEMAELQKELSKAIRGMYTTGNYDTKGMLEEIADVTLMLKQIMVMYNIDEDAVRSVMHTKAMRLERRIDSTYF